MHTSHNANKIFLKLVRYYVEFQIVAWGYMLMKKCNSCCTFNYIIALGSIFSLEKANNFLPRSLSDAPMW